MAVWGWLQRIAQNSSGTSAGSSCSQQVSQLVKAHPSRNDAIAYAVKLAELVIDVPEALAFYQSTFAKHPSQLVSYDTLRKQGDLLDKNALKALGFRTNMKLSAQFYGTLNERGRADPVGSASIIGLVISTALSTLSDIGNMQVAGIDLAKFRASNMATGPCTAAAKLDGQCIPIHDVPMLPFETCPHPDQCACHYQAWLSALDD